MNFSVFIVLAVFASFARADVGLNTDHWTDLSGHGGAVTQSVWLPAGGGKLLTADWSGQIMLWDASRVQNLATMSIAPGFVRSLQVFDGGKRFVACTNGKWVACTTQPLAVLHSQKAPSYYHAVTVSPDGQTIAALVAGKHVDLFSARDGSPQGGFDLTETVEALAYLPDGRLLIPSTKSEFPTFNGLKPAEALKLPGSVGRVARMVVSPDGKNLALITRAELFVIPLTPGQSPLQISPQAGTLSSLSWLGNAQLVTASDAGMLQRFDATSGRKLDEVRFDNGQCSTVAGSGEGDWIAMGGGTYSDPSVRPSRQMTGDNRVRVRALQEGVPVVVAKAAPPPQPAAAPAPVTAGSAGYVAALEKEMQQAASQEDLYLALLFKQERDLVLNRVALPAPAHEALRTLRARFVP